MARHRHRRKRQSGKHKKLKKALIIIGSILLFFIIVIDAGIIYFLGSMTRVKINKDNLDVVEPSPDTFPDLDLDSLGDNIVNIALFGVDTRDSSAAFGDQGRSDSIIILSVNKTDNTLKMISVLRDSKVPIDGYDPQKINAAYKYGRAPLAIRTLNKNFKINISDYVTVDFGQLEKVIDLLGGVEVQLTGEEAEKVNQIASEAMGYNGWDAQEGVNILNGAQAVSFSRIRSIDSDYYRAGRQRAVMEAIFKKMRTKSVREYPSLIRDMLSCVETSMSYTQILSLATSINIRTAQTSSYTMPDPDYEENLFGGIDDTGSWVWIYDLDKAAKRIHTIIYGGNEQQK
ncbi:MAG: LCP family protein [Lachnospiraceae bacterium]|nr:LCP family protein [Lachnospiraceae bacterium]